MNNNKFAVFLTHKRLLLLGTLVIAVLVLAVIFTPGVKNLNLPLMRTENIKVYISPLPASPSPVDSALLQEAISEQTAVDRDYAGWQEAVKNDFPWKKHLPLYSENYYVYFDINDSIFIARLYLAPEVELAQVKQQILTTLDSKGIPYNDYPFQWLLL